jgi:hypothetical protein
MTTEQMDKLEKEKAYLEKKIKELITYGDVENFDPDADTYVDIAISHLQLGLTAINKRLLNYA